MASRLPPPLSRRYVFLAFGTAVILWFWVSHSQPSSFPSWNIYSNSPQSANYAIDDIFDYPPVHSSAIKQVCSATRWNESIVFTCDDNTGGIGHVRNSILNCVRFSIAAGAGMVLPRITVRNESDAGTDRLTNMAHMFDTRHFVDSISLSCPGLRLYSDLENLKKVNNVENPIPFRPEMLSEMKDSKNETALPKDGIEKSEEWRELFHEWYTNTVSQHQFKERTKGPMFVALLHSYLTWPVLSDGPAFSSQFGKMLKLRADARGLASKVVVNMAEKYDIGPDVHAIILKEAFWGVHLGTENDSLQGLPKDGKEKLYPTNAVQSKLFLDHMTKERDNVNTNLVYVASGDPTQVAKFWKDAKLMNWTVITKLGLLKDKDLAELGDLGWDQQALVDFMVLSKASRYFGAGNSGFDWALAGRREVSLLNKNGTSIDGLKEEYIKESKPVTGGEIAFDNVLSTLFGGEGEAKTYQPYSWP